MTKKLPFDILYYITHFLDYKSYYIFKKAFSSQLNIENDFFDKKINIIKNFMKKKLYSNFADMKNLNRKGYLLNLEKTLNKPELYEGKTIQLISAFQYNFSYIEAGNIVEGKLIKTEYDAWVIFDKTLNKVHPFINPFILERSIRLLR
jgi:hypothetical protein